LRKTVVPALESVSLESIQNISAKSDRIFRGPSGGTELEEQFKTYKREVNSHRRISELQLSYK